MTCNTKKIWNKVEEDCLPLIQKPKNKVVDDNYLGFVISGIPAWLNSVEFYSFFNFGREGGRQFSS